MKEFEIGQLVKITGFNYDNCPSRTRNLVAIVLGKMLVDASNIQRQKMLILCDNYPRTKCPFEIEFVVFQHEHKYEVLS